MLQINELAKMKITIDTEKDSKEDIRNIIRILQKATGDEAKDCEESVPKAISPVEVQEIEGIRETEGINIEKSEEEKQKESEELLKILTRPAKQQNIKGSSEGGLPGVPKSVKEAYELTEELETY